MKRKKWSEPEEKTLLTKYSDLSRTGTLQKLKTREKKFKPIAEHVNSVHHLLSQSTFPFRWTWRDVSVKIQNMRHQYLGVKSKIRIGSNRVGSKCVGAGHMFHHDFESEEKLDMVGSSGDGYEWGEGDDHWGNFSLYKEVFGDVELEESEGEEGEEGEEGMELAMVVVGMREEALRREERRREREWKRGREIEEVRQVGEMESCREEDPLDHMSDADFDLEMKWRTKQERRSRIDWELRRRREAEERWEEEEMGWRERLIGMQLDHERQMMQMQAEACHNQMQMIGTMARLISHFFVPSNDGLESLPPHQDLSSLQNHPDGLSGDVKPDSSSPSEFL